MISSAKRLRIPVQLRAVIVGGAAVLACSSTSSTVPSKHGGPLSEAGPSRDGGHDSGRDASPYYPKLDGGPCTIKVPAGKVCETTCYNVEKNPIEAYACQVYCSPPEGGFGSCSCNGGVALEGGVGFCPGGLDCEVELFPGAGTRVLC
jgi:hypothetical protein